MFSFQIKSLTLLFFISPILCRAKAPPPPPPPLGQQNLPSQIIDLALAPVRASYKYGNK